MNLTDSKKVRKVKQNRFQFSLRTVLLVFASFCLLFALVYTNPNVRVLILSVICANLLGLVIALFVTHVLKMPNDGSYPNQEAPNDDSDQNQNLHRDAEN